MTKSKSKATNRAKRAGEAVNSVRENPYVQRLSEDEELRDTIRDAFDAARSAFKRAQSSKHPARSVIDDNKLQNDLRDAAESLRTASERLREEPARESEGGHLGRLLLIAVVGAILAIALSEDLRQGLLDRLFGAEEEFEYDSATSPGGVSTNGTGSTEAAGAEATS